MATFKETGVKANINRPPSRYSIYRKPTISMTITHNSILDRVYGTRSNIELESHYHAWAESYDEDLLRFGYRVPAVAAGFCGHHVELSATPIPNAGCGTGLIGEAL